MRTMLIGLGNPLLTDDGVGAAVARGVARAVGARRDVAIAELHTGGIALMEACVGFDRVLLVDAMTAGEAPGTIYRRSIAELAGGRNCACAHDTTLSVAFDVGRFLRLSLPSDVEVWGVEPADVMTFGETLSPAVSAAVPVVVGEIVAALGGNEARP